MIVSFRDRDAARLFAREPVRRLPPELQRAALRKLRMLHNARPLKDLWSPPANRLEKLRGRRKGQYSVRINDQWRVCFVWRDGNAHDVEIADYH